MENICDLKATIKINIFSIPEDLLSNIIGQLVDDTTSYLTEAWGLTLDEFCVEVDNLPDDLILLS